MKKRFATGLVLVAAIVGCGPTLQEMTGPRIGCPASEVLIVEEHEHWSTKTWTAQCRGLRFYCANESSVTNTYGTASNSEGGNARYTGSSVASNMFCTRELQPSSGGEAPKAALAAPVQPTH